MLVPISFFSTRENTDSHVPTKLGVEHVPQTMFQKTEKKHQEIYKKIVPLEDLGMWRNYMNFKIVSLFCTYRKLPDIKFEIANGLVF